MIYEILYILNEQVNNYFESLGLARSVVLGNIAQVDNASQNASITEKVVCSLINIKEEASLKNLRNVSVVGNKVTNLEPKVNLNLFLLYSANRSEYRNSLIDISTVIEYFQGHKVFTQKNTIYNRNDALLSRVQNFKVKMDLFTPSLEELSYIWGVLGGKQHTSALYKLSMLSIDSSAVINQGAAASKVGANFTNN